MVWQRLNPSDRSSPLRRRPHEAGQRLRPRHCASMPPYLAMIANQAQHIKVDEPGRTQCPEVAPKRRPQTKPKIGDQHLGRQIGADFPITPGNFGTLARIGDEAAPGLRPMVGKIVVAPELLPQRLGQKLRSSAPGKPDQEFAILDKPQWLLRPEQDRRSAPTQMLGRQGGSLECVPRGTVCGHAGSPSSACRRGPHRPQRPRAGPQGDVTDRHRRCR